MATGTIQKNMVLLWTNSAPTSQFGAQTIPLDLSKYDAVLVYFRLVNSGGDASAARASLIALKDSILYNVFNYGAIDASSIGTINRRQVTVTNTGVEFTDNKQKAFNSNASATTTNTFNIPVEIYGLKA